MGFVQVVNPKLTLKVNSIWIKIRAHNFARQVLKQTHFENLKEKRKWFFDHTTTLK